MAVSANDEQHEPRQQRASGPASKAPTAPCSKKKSKSWGLGASNGGALARSISSALHKLFATKKSRSLVSSGSGASDGSSAEHTASPSPPPTPPLPGHRLLLAQQATGLSYEPQEAGGAGGSDSRAFANTAAGEAAGRAPPAAGSSVMAPSQHAASAPLPPAAAAAAAGPPSSSPSQADAVAEAASASGKARRKSRLSSASAIGDMRPTAAAAAGGGMRKSGSEERLLPLYTVGGSPGPDSGPLLKAPQTPCPVVSIALRRRSVGNIDASGSPPLSPPHWPALPDKWAAATPAPKLRLTDQTAESPPSCMSAPVSHAPVSAPVSPLPGTSSRGCRHAPPRTANSWVGFGAKGQCPLLRRPSASELLAAASLKLGQALSGGGATGGNSAAQGAGPHRSVSRRGSLSASLGMSLGMGPAWAASAAAVRNASANGVTAPLPTAGGGPPPSYCRSLTGAGGGLGSRSLTSAPLMNRASAPLVPCDAPPAGSSQQANAKEQALVAELRGCRPSARLSELLALIGTEPGCLLPAPETPASPKRRASVLRSLPAEATPLSSALLFPQQHLAPAAKP